MVGEAFDTSEKHHLRTTEET